MTEKRNLSIKEIKSFTRWEELILLIENPSIFDSSLYQSVFFNDLLKLCVLKGNEPVALFYAPKLKKHIVDSDFFVHSGVRFLKNDSIRKKSSINSDNFSICQILCDFICDNFTEIVFRTHPDILDLRPFLWKNYGLKNEMFYVNLRYTLMIDISEMFLKRYENSELYYNFDRNITRDIKKGLKCDYEITYNENIEIFKKLYTKTFERYGVNISITKLNIIANIIENTINKNSGLFSVLIRDSIPTYFAAYAISNHTAYHLYGGGDYDHLERYDCSILHWESFKKLSSMGVHTVDLEGINSPNRGSYKLGFGGNIMPYYELTYRVR